jgi:hypothetical protein
MNVDTVSASVRNSVVHGERPSLQMRERCVAEQGGLN